MLPRLTKRRALAGLLAVAVAVAVFLGVLLRPSSRAQSAGQEKNGASLIASKRERLPNVGGKTLSPPPTFITFSSLRGRPAFLDVWASWCVPCQKGAPTLARLHRDYGKKVRFVGIDVEDTRGEARAFVRRHGLRYEQIFDARASLAQKLGFFGLPTFYFVDRRGRIAAKLVGEQDEPILRAHLDALVREARAG